MARAREMLKTVMVFTVFAGWTGAGWAADMIRLHCGIGSGGALQVHLRVDFTHGQVTECRGASECVTHPALISNEYIEYQAQAYAAKIDRTTLAISFTREFQSTTGKCEVIEKNKI